MSSNSTSSGVDIDIKNSTLFKIGMVVVGIVGLTILYCIVQCVSCCFGDKEKIEDAEQGADAEDSEKAVDVEKQPEETKEMTSGVYLKPDDLNLGVFFFTVFMTCILYKIITIY
jgi:Na+-transporting methylmalonyl-CoA/oxaloacetate decarboxylase gamma subunit